TPSAPSVHRSTPHPPPTVVLEHYSLAHAFVRRGAPGICGQLFIVVPRRLSHRSLLSRRGGMTREHGPMTTSRTSGDATSGTDAQAAELDRLRPLAFSVAYRMLGSVAEAEDVVQEALTRVSQAEDVRNPDAFVTTVTTRISIDVLRSARVRRESYVGEWLPEPLVGPVHLPVAMASPPPDAAAHAELAGALSTAFLVLLETLTPTERAAFLLHDVLGFPHSEAADVIGTTPVAARQLASRARRRIAERRESGARDRTADDGTRPDVGRTPHTGTRPRPGAGTPAGTAPPPHAGTTPHGRATDAGPSGVRAAHLAGASPRTTRTGTPASAAPADRAEELVTRFLAACEEGAVEPFLALLAEDVVLTGDSGGNVPRGMSIARPVAGQGPVARTLSGFLRYGMPLHFERALVGGR